MRALGATIEAARRVARSLAALGHIPGILFNSETRVRHGQRFLTVMEGRSFELILSAFENHPDGRALLEARPDTERLLADRGDLNSRPAGSFARAYLDFLVPNGFDAADYIEVAKQHAVGFSADPKRSWVRQRIDSTHDVRHTLTGYGSDHLGEACLLTFRVAQVGHRGAGVLAALVALGCIFIHGPRATLRAIAEAYRHGRTATLIDLCPFEFDLSTPIETCRAKLRLPQPVVYQSVLARQAKRQLQNSYSGKPAGQETPL